MDRNHASRMDSDVLIPEHVLFHESGSCSHDSLGRQQIRSYLWCRRLGLYAHLRPHPTQSPNWY